MIQISINEGTDGRYSYCVVDDMEVIVCGNEPTAEYAFALCEQYRIDQVRRRMEEATCDPPATAS